MPSSGRRNGPANLLIDSPSDSDVPDLELIAPVKPRKKKLFSKKFSPRISIKDGDGPASMICSSSCALVSLLFSLVLGLVVLSCFTLSLCNQLNALKQTLADRGSPSTQSSDEIGNLQKAVDELRSELKGCCDSAKSSSDNNAQIKSTPSPATSNVGLDSNLNNELANDVAQLANSTISMASSINGFKKSIENITSRLDLLEEKCSTTVCPPPSNQTGFGAPGEARNNSPALLTPTVKRRRSDGGAGEEYFQFVRKP